MSQLQKELNNDDQTALEEFKSYNLDKIDDVCKFLSSRIKVILDIERRF
jgi:hypothetical protein